MNEEQRTGPEAETIEGDAARMSAAQRTAATDGEPGAEVASDAPWCQSITKGQSSHVGEEGTAVGSEDWFECSVCVEWQPEAIESLAAKLEAIKEACQNSHEEHDWIDLPGVEKLQVMRTGKSKGGGRGTHFEFLLNHHGIEFLLANRRTVSTKMPNAWLRLTGEMCLLIGAAEGRAHFRSLIESLGGKVAYEKISRIDLTLDIAGVPIQAFYEPFQNGQFISAGRKDDFHRENQELTGFSRGRSPCRIEFYDKLRKTLQGVDTNVIDAMVHRRWGGRFPAAATRIEFSVRRDWFKKFGISTVQDYFRERAAIARKLTEEVFRLTEAPVDRENKHQSRATTHPLWRDVQRAFEHWAGTSDRKLKRDYLTDAEPIKLLQQCLGCLRRSALLRGVEMTSIDDVEFYAMKSIGTVLRSEEDQQKWLEEYRRESSQYPAFRKERAA